MTRPDAELRNNARQEKCRSVICQSAAVSTGALLVAWPAIYNGYPLLYPDSMTYLKDGHIVAQALFLHRLSKYYGMRSFIYSLGILPWHWDVTAWPVIVFQGFLTAYIIWLLVRSIVPRQTAASYVALVALLSLLTSLGWFASLIMPDILGPLLYLCIYLLVFARESLSRAESLTVILIACWAVASHATHLMLAAGLCILLGLLVVWRRPNKLRFVAELAMIVLVPAAAQLALHMYLYGHPTLNGEPPPFLMARVIADGPGRSYLKQHCGEVKLAICQDVSALPDNPDDFLWAAGGIWQNASKETQQRLRQEEMGFVLATLRAYPREQLSKSLANFGQQLTTFDLAIFDPNDWILRVFDSVLPRERASYLQSRQARDELPYEFFTSVQTWTVLASLVVIGVFTPRMWRRRPPRLVGLALVIISVIVANAFVTGTLSMVENRFQSRVIWLLPLLAGVLALEWHYGEARPQPSGS